MMRDVRVGSGCGSEFDAMQYAVVSSSTCSVWCKYVFVLAERRSCSLLLECYVTSYFESAFSRIYYRNWEDAVYDAVELQLKL